MLRELSASERSLDRRKTVEKKALGKKMSALEDLKAKRERKQGRLQSEGLVPLSDLNLCHYAMLAFYYLDRFQLWGFFLDI